MSVCERKKVEMRFAHMKRILKLDRLRLRGLSGAKDEVVLTVISSFHVSFSLRPYFAISTASLYWPDGPHLGHSTRRTWSLPIRSEKMIAPRGA